MKNKILIEIYQLKIVQIMIQLKIKSINEEDNFTIIFSKIN